jgi:CheY-like chemotaxis protein
MFEVIDAGMGISSEDQSKIFEPFAQGFASQTKGGTGLGLSITQRHIELMGGKLELESELGKGSRFFFTLPFAPATNGMTKQFGEADIQVVRLAEGYSVKALVADDIAENRDVLRQLLTEIGCVVVLAEDGPMAVETYRLNHPDIVFMDIRMPSASVRRDSQSTKGEEGLEAAQQIWAEFGHNTAKIVAVSASALIHEQQGYLNAGFDAFIPKPFERQQIYDCLANLLNVEYKYANKLKMPCGRRMNTFK